MSEVMTLAPCGRGEADEFVRTFNELGPPLVRTLCSLLGNFADAQDASQDTFLKYWRAQRTATPLRNPRPWIFRVGLNAARDIQRTAWHRRARSLKESAGVDGDALACPQRILESEEILEQVRRALKELRPEERAVFLLRQNTRLSYDEIAFLRDCPVGTVKTHMHRALRKLRQALAEHRFR